MLYIYGILVFPGISTIIATALLHSGSYITTIGTVAALFGILAGVFGILDMMGCGS